MKRVFLIIIIGALAGISACTAAELDIQATVDYRVQLALSSTQAAEPTATPYPTATSYATIVPLATATMLFTSTPYPTLTAYATATAYPTFTPWPTATATPSPTVTPTRPPVAALPVATAVPANLDLQLVQTMIDMRRAALDFGGTTSAALANNRQVNCADASAAFAKIENAPFLDTNALTPPFRNAYHGYREAIEILQSPSAVLDLAQQCRTQLANGEPMLGISADFIKCC